MRPLSGTSVGFVICSIYSNEVMSFEIPPCMVMIFSSISATIGI